MQIARLPENEAERVATLQSMNILDTPREDRFDRYTRITARIFDMPIALISLVDKYRQWFKSAEGLEADETPRDISFCGHAILGDGVFEVTLGDKLVFSKRELGRFPEPAEVETSIASSLGA